MVEHLHEILYKARERWSLKSRDRIEIGSPFDLLVFRKPETVSASGVRRVENKFLEPIEWILFQVDENMLFASRWLRNG